MRRTRCRSLSVALVAAMLVTLLSPAPGWAAAPVTTILLQPNTGPNAAGWWNTPLNAFASVDQAATLYYRYDSAAVTTLAVEPGVPADLGFFPQGVSTLYAYSVNSAAETETPGALTQVKVDTVPPDQPGAPTCQVVGESGIRLTWQPSSDPVSGISGYAIYRDDHGDFVDPVKVAVVSGTSYTEVPPARPEGWWYAITAIDTAGNESLLSWEAGARYRTSALSLIGRDVVVVYGTRVSMTASSTVTPDWGSPGPDVGGRVRLDMGTTFGWTTVTSALTNSAGRAVLSFVPQRSGRLRAVRVPDVLTAGTEAPQSPYVYVRPKIALTPASSYQRTSYRVRFYGSIAPLKAGAGRPVFIQRLTGGRWVNVRKTYADSRGRYSVYVREWTRGRKAYRTYTPLMGELFLKGYSPARYVTWR